MHTLAKKSISGVCF